MFQFATLIVIYCAAFLYFYTVLSVSARVYERVVALCGIGACIRFSWLQWQWIESERVSHYWNAHDAGVAGFLLMVSLVLIIGIRERMK